MLEKGFIKIDRSIVNWRWFKDSNTSRVFFFILLQANYRKCNFEGMVIDRGQMVTSYSQISDALDISVMQARTAIKHLKSTGEITVEAHSKYSVITVQNYDAYQCREQAHQQADNKQITSRQQASNNNGRKIKKDKKDKKDKELFLSDARSALLTSKQRSELVSMSSVSSVAEYENKISEWQSRTGKRCRDPFGEIKKWIAQDKAKGKDFSGSSYDLSDFERYAMSYDFSDAPWNDGGDEE